MKTAARLFLSLLTAVSTAAFLLAVILYPRSYRVADLLSCDYPQQSAGPRLIHAAGVWSSRGQLAIYYHRSVAYSEDRASLTPRLSLAHFSPVDIAVSLTTQQQIFLGFHFIPNYWPPAGRCLIVPYWFVLLLTCLLPLRGVLALRSARIACLRREQGLCSACGYDMRATPDRCPECGHPVPTNATADPR